MAPTLLVSPHLQRSEMDYYRPFEKNMLSLAKGSRSKDANSGDRSMSDMLTTRQLKARGWTDSLIPAFLSKPDETRCNPKYSSAPRMKLYKKEGVEDVEISEEFKSPKEAANKRREAGKKAVQTKQARMDEYLANLEIDVPEMERDELIRA
jgi:hypothetical protein